MSSQAVPITVGFAPSQFPRDPVEINQFDEHMFVGQILEPLTDAVGESWTVDPDGKRIVYEISSKKRFSNGRPVTAQDVAFSLSRHLENRSQSAFFLSEIENLNADSDSRLIVSLNRPNVAIVKALSRDQLGILPEGWRFDSKSDEPYIGTGPYRLVKKSANWHLIKNDYFSFPGKLTVPEWRVIKLEAGRSEVPEGPIPNFIPSITGTALAKVRSKGEFDPKLYTVKKSISFAQTSLWIFPSSRFFKSPETRGALATLLDRAISRYTTSLEYSRATGLIPKGILGHNPIMPKVEGQPLPTGSKLKLAYRKGAFDDFLNSGSFREILKESGLTLELIPFEPSTLEKLTSIEVDIVTGAWAGAYDDPTGFLGLLTPMLRMDF